MKNKFIDIIQTILIIFLIVFGLFLAYQIILKILGGSWQTESLIISLLMLNIGITFTLAINHAKINARIAHLTYQFRSLAKDFKEHLSN